MKIYKNELGHMTNMATMSIGGRSGGAMVLGKLAVQGRPTYLDKSRARASCACSRFG